MNELSKYKQDMSFTYNVTLRRVRATIVAVGKNEYHLFRVYVFSLK